MIFIARHFFFLLFCSAAAVVAGENLERAPSVYEQMHEYYMYTSWCAIT